MKTYHKGFTRQELDEVCICSHTREDHATGLTKRGSYCFNLNIDIKSCDCKEFRKDTKK